MAKKLQKTTQLWVLVVVVLLDLLAVSLVVPLLPARYRELGVGAKALGFASSAYSLAQIVGGLALGALSDRSLGHRGLLLLSFVGAATAYAIVGWPGATFHHARGVAGRRGALQADDDSLHSTGRRST